ncbi:hypothetical protein AB0J86_24250 [Micromonospora sp. NPDC049559]|uniref:hypothetical protein n=1 Tax=Micromonospora sp. NPDC049559 TaxID=3155923 RepID=UPI003414B9E1
MRVPTPSTVPPATRAARRPTRTALLATAGLLLVPLAGCAGTSGEPTPLGPAPVGGSVTAGPAGTGGTTPTGAPDGSPTSTRPPLSNSRPPTVGPAAKPPSEPTDQRRNEVVGGTVTRGGPGPCYGLVTDDGVEYALYGRDAGTLTEGRRLVVLVGPQLLKVDCGPGRPASIVEVRSGG